MARRTYEKTVRKSLIFNIPYTEWVVRDENGMKIGTIRKDGDQFTAHSGRYDADDNFISSSSGSIYPTYRKAQSWFQRN